MDPISLTEGQMAELRACKSENELRSLAVGQGIELSDAQLEVISGGIDLGSQTKAYCPGDASGVGLIGPDRALI